MHSVGHNTAVFIPQKVPPNGFLGFSKNYKRFLCAEPSLPGKIPLANQLGVWLRKTQWPCGC